MLYFLRTVSQYLGSPRPRYSSQYKTERGKTDRQTETQWDIQTVTARPTKREREGAREREKETQRETETRRVGEGGGDTQRGREKGWDRNLK